MEQRPEQRAAVPTTTATASQHTAHTPAAPAARGRWGRRRQDPVQAAGNAIVTAAKVGRILGRSGWRIARQLPGVAAVEQIVETQAQRAVHEVARLISPEEQRAARLAEGAATDPAPLRTAMSELLERSTAANPSSSREYLFGTIVSQLVPDEARILAALATGRPYPAVDVVGRKDARTLVGNVSTVVAAAGVALPASGPTYLDRLDSFGLLSFLPPQPGDDQLYGVLTADPSVASLVRNGARVVRKTVTLSPLGREFWAACAPGA